MRNGDSWAGWPAIEDWTDEDHEKSLYYWLKRRLDRDFSMESLVWFYARIFKGMWHKQFGKRRPVPQYIRDYVQKKVKLARKREQHEP